jgi:predicted MFS family arabinose efflux permease
MQEALLTQTGEGGPLHPDPGPRPAAGSIFQNRGFCLLLLGSSLSGLGDQFTIVALPWLVLKLTGNGAALGLVLAAMALPRAVFILLGGAVVDRMSPRRVLLAADLVNAALIAALAALVLSHEINIQMVYVLAVGIGLATAFAYPAGSAILPQLVEPEQLQAANSLITGIAQVCALLGPAIAGIVISLGSLASVSNAAPSSLHGIGVALSIDAASFVFSLGSLLVIRVRGDARAIAAAGANLLSGVAIGLQAVWKDAELRAFLLYGGAASALIGGSLQVGLPVLAGTHLSLGATSLGLLMTAVGVGFLAGSVLSGAALRAIQGRIGVLVLGSDGLAGALLAGLALVSSTLGGVTLLLLLGALQGILQVAFVTWLQRRVAAELMGRTMSIVMFVFTGIAPVAAVAAGALLNAMAVGTLFAGAGLCLSSLALYCLTRSRMRRVVLHDV